MMDDTRTLRGRKAIAAALGLPVDGSGWRLGERRVRYLEDRHGLPVCRDARTVCLSMPALLQWQSAQEAAR
ncbi:DNA-binding protein [Tanticharoenia sakaeratensis]|nr:DNA-binding protein [Tanticharoenia sakaeratensis]